MAGIMFLIACGKITFIIDLLNDNTKLLAASICPLSIACIPPLKISDKKAPAFNAITIIPDTSGDNILGSFDK